MRSSRSSRVLAFRRSTALCPLACGALLAGGLLTQSGAARAEETSSSAATSASAVRAARMLLAQLPGAQSQAQNGPVVTVLQPGYSDVLRGNTSIVVGIQARRYPASSIELLVDGKSASNGPMPITAGASLNFNWKTSDFADGPHRLTVRVTDTQGFRSDAEVRVYINNGKAADVTPPTLSWQNINSGDLLRGEKKLKLEAADNFGVKYVWVSIKSTLDPSKPVKMWMVNRAPYAFTLNSGSLPDGLYTLESLAWDALENEGRAEKITFGIANNTINPTWMSELDKARANAKAPVVFDASVESTAPRTNPSAKANHLIVPKKSAEPSRVAKGMERPDNLGAVSEEAAMTGVFTELDSAPAKTTKSARAASEKRSLIASMPGDSRRVASTRNTEKTAAPATGAQLSVIEARDDAPASARTKNADSRSIARGVATLPRGDKRLATAPLAPAAIKKNSSNAEIAGNKNGSSLASENAAANSESGAPTKIARRTPMAAPKADTGVARPSLPRVVAIPNFEQPQRSNAKAASITIAPMGKEIPAFHQAKAGETLSEIAARYGVSRELLLAVNPEAKARVLASGQKLRLPRLLQVRYAGKPVASDVSSMMVGSTGVTPFRFLFEQQGGTMTWDAAKQRVVARTETQEVTVTIGSRAAVVNRKEVMMDLAAFLLSGRTMVPVRFFEKALHAQIEWDPGTGRLFVAMSSEANAKNASIKAG